MPKAKESREHSPRAVQMRRVIQDCMTRRESGYPVTDAEVIGANPDLMPELLHELQILDVIQTAVQTGSAIKPTTEGVARTRGMTINTILNENIDGYQISREIHRGTQGVVYEAHQISTGRRVAIKIRRDGFFGDPRLRDRFVREIDILALLDHPNIVGVIDSGVGNGKFYYVMAFVDGVPLDMYMETARVSVEQTMRLFEKIATTVNAAHLRGIIHRDLKPSNILVDTYGEPRLLDFGLARLSKTPGERLPSGSGSSHLTRTGQFLGSLPWTSPEQAEGVASRIDLRTDVYSLGVVLFQMLTGKLPYEVEPDVESASKTIVKAQIPSPSRMKKGIDKDIDVVVHKCLQKEPSVRYQSAGELAEDVQRYLAHLPLLARPQGRTDQVRMFVRRNKVLVGLNAVLLMVLLGATVIMAAKVLELRSDYELLKSQASDNRSVPSTLRDVSTHESNPPAIDARTPHKLDGSLPQ